MRKSGILMPMFSLPSRFGTGCFSGEARGFIDFLSDSGQSLWQLLPLCPTAYGDSPYQSPSAFAGNPYFIDIDTLKEEGLLTEAEAEEYASICPKGDRVDYGFLYSTRPVILRRAFERFDTASSDYQQFKEREKYWLDDYTLFAAIKDRMGGAPPQNWEHRYKHREGGFEKDFKEDTEYYAFLQYEFSKQWSALKSYANSKGIELIGDIPLYVSADSADLWAHPGLFEAREDLTLTAVAGCPPDMFDANGQLWGNPLYRWDAHKEQGYGWWIKRIRRNMELYDILRLDHFRGFAGYYSIPDGSDARGGRWLEGPRWELFDAIFKECPEAEFIAEDLGYITEDVRDLLKDTGIGGMKVLQFAFDGNPDNIFLPHKWSESDTAYTGTHDNQTLVGWIKSNPGEARCSAQYMNVPFEGECDLAFRLIRLAMESSADRCIVPLQDYLCLDDNYRINAPGQGGGQWTVRLGREHFSDGLRDRILEITKTSGRGANA